MEYLWAIVLGIFAAYMFFIKYKRIAFNDYTKKYDDL